jgi:hypothetical protein
MYPFSIKHLGQAGMYVLYAPTAQNRRDWCDKIRETQERHASALASQNSNPFRLKVLSKDLIAQREVVTGKQQLGRIRVTPLDRALEEGALDETRELTFTKAEIRQTVLCADTYVRNGDQVLVIGTDKGILTLGGEVNGTRRWKTVRSINQELYSKQS